MEIVNKVLISVSESDIVDGKFTNKDVIEVADNCFYNLDSLRSVALPKVKKIGDDCFRSNAALTTISVPLLATCGDDCFSYNDALTTISVPLLATCGDDCFSSNAALTTISVPLLATCGDDCFRYNADLTTISVPLLATCGSYCFRYNDALTTISVPLLATCGSYCFRYNDALTTISVKKHTLNTKDVDGYCFIVENQRASKGIQIYSGYNLLLIKDTQINKGTSFVAEKEGFTAHGETVKKAVSDLQFKIVAEKLKSEPIEADTIITINHYRLITGACEFGVKSWMEQNKVKENIKASELLPILKKTGAYGIDKFQSLVTF
jgi:hypothetical protein